MKFTELNLDDRIKKSLEKLNYETLTPIQEKIIPAIQEGQDVIGCSQTGSGKTGAFLIPIINKLLADKKNKALIVTPTRELAMQITNNVKDLYDGNSINRSLIIGGASIRDQLLSIKKNPRLIVGTPGRLNDFLDSNKLDIADFNILVLDEMDRMLDMGFSVQIETIVEKLDKKRQTMLFSATVSKKIERVTQKYLKEPLIVKIGETNQPSVNVTQEIIKIKNEEKFEKLVTLIRTDSTFSIVFVKTKRSAERLSDKILESGFESKAIHGDFKQSKRDRIIRDFRNKKFNVLVATDVVARGIDIPHIDTVFNYDLPQSPEDYIHRIGRCSRGIDIKGKSVSFCNKDDESKLKAINSLIKDGDYEEETNLRKDIKRSPRRDNDRKSNRGNQSSRRNNHAERGARDGEFKRNSENDRSYKKSNRPERSMRDSDNHRSSEGDNFNKRDYKKRDFNKKSEDSHFDRRDKKRDFDRNYEKNSFDKKGRKSNFKRDFESDRSFRDNKEEGYNRDAKSRNRRSDYKSKSRSDENKNGYNIDGLMSKKRGPSNFKRPSHYMIFDKKEKRTK